MGHKLYDYSLNFIRTTKKLRFQGENGEKPERNRATAVDFVWKHYQRRTIGD